MANWDKLNKELDSTLNSMTPENWIEWMNKTQDSCIIDWDLHQKVMAKKNKNTITRYSETVNADTRNNTKNSKNCRYCKNNRSYSTSN